MKVFLSICFILTFALIYSQTRIIGGSEINIEDAPWMANVRIINTAGVKLFNRSGIVVSENLVLTASHDWPDYNYDHIEVHVGGAFESAGVFHKVHRVIHHPTRDAVLLELTEPLAFGKNIRSIDYRSCIDESLYAPGTDATVYGWGRTVPEVPSRSLKLRAADVKIISPAEANMIYGASVVDGNTIVSVGDTGICMGGKGDSGGSLVVGVDRQDHVLAGITIYADTRAVSENSGLTVYSKVKPIIAWIDSCECRITGPDTVYSLGASFEIENPPPDAASVEWNCSGLTGINSSMDFIDVIPSEIDGETTGHVSATVTTDLGTITIRKPLVIMPRIDIDINVEYNEMTSKYEIKAKTVNMDAVDENDILKCRHITDDVKLMGFMWTYNGNIALGQEAIFEVNPNPPITHTISVSKYECNRTVKLDKTFVIKHSNNEFVTVYNEPGMITVGGVHVSTDVEASEELQMTYMKNSGESSVLLNTSRVAVKNVTEKTVDAKNCKVFLYSRTGTLLYSGNFNNSNAPLCINTSSFRPGVYILHVRNLDTGNIVSRLILN